MTTSLTLPAATPTKRLPVVVENAKFAWTNQESSVLTQLNDDLVHDYREALDTAAINRLGPLLTQVWEERGYQVRWGSYDEAHVSMRGIDRATYWAVTDEAASRLDVDQLVRDADLVGIARSTYSD
jgi:hypothetical protein